MSPSCLLCGGETQLLRHPKIADYYWCQSCDYIFKDQEHLISKEAELKIYEGHNNSIEDPRYVDYFKNFIDSAIVDYASKGREGLDFGSGPSPVLAQILEGDYGYTMDIYDKFYSPNPVYQGKQYDLITSTEVVEHLRNPIEYFKLFKSLLKPGGVLAIMTQFHPQASGDFINWHYMRDRSHISFFTIKTMAYIAQSVGFEIVYTNDVRYISMKHSSS
jgi:SAM-dependent methyltransferase